VDDEMAAHCIETPLQIQAKVLRLAWNLEKAGRMSVKLSDGLSSILYANESSH